MTQHFFFLGIIEESDSVIVTKDEDGTEIKLKVLKHPIAINDLPCVYEEEGENDRDENKKHMKVELKDVRRKSKRKRFNNKPAKKIKDTPKLLRRKMPKRKDALEKRLEKKSIRVVPSKELIMSPIKYLKEPVLIEEDKLKENEPLIFNVKTVEGTYVQRSTKQSTLEYQKWKQNALTLFEFSHVYPFVHANNKYKCFMCTQLFLEAKDLKEHQSSHSNEEFKLELRNRIRDKSLKIDVSYLQCKICSETLSDLYALKFHLKHHGKNIEPDLQDNLIPFKLSGDTFECQICHVSFPKLRLLTIHMSEHFSNFHCEQCGSAFISLNLLKRHLQTHKNGSFPCEKCDKVFSNPAKRTLHVKGVHLKQWPRICPICPERFNSNYKRMKHLRLVHNKAPSIHKCETCGREYDLKYQLLVHIRSVHLQERNQECSVCHARFFSKYCLSRHMVIHTGEKKFKCEICGKAYARKKTLQEHFKSHDEYQRNDKNLLPVYGK